MKKTKAEQELGRQKDKEIERLTKEIDRLRDLVIEQISIIKRHKVYQEFMERVLDHTDEVRVDMHCLFFSYYCTFYSLMRLVG